MEFIFIAIVIVAIVAYLAIVYIRKKYSEQLITTNQEIEKLLNETLEKKLADISQLNLTGESLTEFEKLDKAYRYLVNRQFPELSETLASVQETVAQNRFLAAKQEFEILDKKLVNTTKRYQEIKQDLQKIEQNTKEQQQAVENLRERYRVVRKTLLAKSFAFGPSLDALEDMLARVEKQFDDYVKLMENGDYIVSLPPLEDLKKETKQLEEALGAIPPLYKDLHNVFPEQYEELQQAITDMQAQGYAFELEMDSQLAQVQTALENLKLQLTDLKIADAQKTDEHLIKQIDQLYEEVEAQYAAKAKVDAKEKYYVDFLQHAQKQQHELMVSLERLKQNYTLTHNEIEDALDLENDLAQIKEHQVKYFEQKEAKEVIYTQQLALYLQNLEKLVKIEEKQKEINEGIAELWKEEKEARIAVENFDIEIHKLKRTVEKLNLPGLSKEYLDYFYRVVQEIKDLDHALGRVQINMDEITKALINTQSDLDVLEAKTNEIIDSSILAEEMLQYSNRYRNRYPEVSQAYQEALEQFKQYDYVGALDTISHAIDAVDPEAFSKVSRAYEEQKKYMTKRN